MPKIFLVSVLFIFSISSFAQKINLSELSGDWKIISYKGLEIITPGMENNEERNERLKLDLKCSKGIFHIDSNSISTSNKLLGFDSCKFNLIHKNTISLNVVANNYSMGYAASFDIDIDSNKVSDDFVKLLDKNYSKKTLQIFDTDYKDVGSNYETLKICVISIDRIGLYRDYDLIILERK